MPMSAENGHNPTNVGIVDYQIGELTFGRGKEMPIPDGLEESYANQPISFAEIVDNARTDLQDLVSAGREATHNLVSPGPDVDRRNVSLARLGLAALAAGAIASYPDTSYAAPLDHSSQPGHTFHLDGHQNYGIVLQGDQHDLKLEAKSGDGGPDPDDDEPIPAATPSSARTPVPGRNLVILPYLGKGVKLEGSRNSTAVPPKPTEKPSPTTTPSPSATPSPSLTPIPSPSVTPSPTTVPQLFSNMIGEKVFNGNLGAVALTTGGMSTYAAEISPANPQIVGIPGTAGYIENGGATGFIVDVEAKPLIDPMPDSSNVKSDVDPGVSIGATILNPWWKEAEVVQASSASYDWEATPPQWKINGEPPCDDDLNVDHASGPLVSPGAVISMMAEGGINGGRTHTIQIDADGNVCAEVIPVPPAPNTYQESNAAAGTVALPQNTKALELRGVSVLRSSEAIPLISRYPALQAVENYRNETGRQMWAYIRGGDEAGQGVLLWGNPDAFAAFREGFLQGILVTPDREWLSYSPDLSPTNLTLAVAQEQGWQAITSSGVSSYDATYPGSLARALPSEDPLNHPVRVKRYLQDAYGVQMAQWHGNEFPGLDIMPYVNPANDIASSTIRNSYLEPVPFQGHYTSKPTTAIEVGLEAAINWRERNGFGPLNRLTIEQRAMLMNANIRANLGRALGRVDRNIFPNDHMRLIFPIGDEYGQAPENWQEILNKIASDYGSYGELMFPIVLPGGNKPDRYGSAMLQAVVAKPDTNLSVIAIPPALGEFRGPGEVMSAPFFQSGMGQAVEAVRAARGGAK